MKRHTLSYADWSGAEYAAAARCLLRGQVASGPKPAQLARRLAEHYRPSTVYPVNSGHSALRIALDLLRRRAPDRNEVLLPSYICPSVVQTIAAAGLTAVPVDIGADLNLLPAAVTRGFGPRTLAVIAPHMFGSPAPIAQIETLCDQAGVFLIDDAAQVVGETCQGRLLGTFGAMGIISFAQSKAVVTGVRGSGGVLLVNRAEFDAEAGQAWHRLAPPSGRLAAFVHFLWDYLWKAHTGNSGYYFARLRAVCGARPPADAGVAHISNLDAAIALVQLARLPQLRAERIRVAEAYHAQLGKAAGISFPQYAPGRLLARVMLALPDGVDLAAFRAAASRRLETRLGYVAPVDPAQPDALAAAWAGRLFGVPFRAGMREQEISQICRILSAALATAQAAPNLRNQPQ